MESHGMSHRHLIGVMLLAGLWAGCGPTSETPRPEPPIPMTKDQTFRMGHQLYMESRFDTASVLLQRAAAMDSLFIDPVRDLAQLHYEWAMRAGEKSRERTEHLRSSRTLFVRLEKLGDHSSETYERLCEISITLNDDHSFVRYAKKNAELYPYDRQFYNLARAYFEVEDFQSVIKSAKESIERFKNSPFVTTYYRLLGRSYMKIGRDQTAERTLVSGVTEANTRLKELKKQGVVRGNDQWQRAHDDKINMLLALRQLHTTYRANDKLEQVEEQLKEEGYVK
jgi:tetratricopeptide (TPR) repeat protein